jgi:WD40 repeat protein
MQLYDSALLFSPEQSKIRQQFDTEAPISIKTLCPSFREWDKCLLTITGVSSSRPLLEVSPDRTKLAIIKQDKVTILILDALTGGHLQSIRVGFEERVIAISYHPDGRHLVSLFSDGKIRIWDIGNRECLQCFDPTKVGGERRYYDSVSCGEYRLPFSTDGRFLAFHSPGDTIELWDVWGGVCLCTFYHDALYNDRKIHWFDWGLDRSGRPLLLVARFIGIQYLVQIDVWNSTTRQLSTSAEVGRGFDGAAVAPDGRRLAVVTYKAISIIRWDPNFSIQKVIDRQMIRSVYDITWAADGKSLAIATGLGMLRWDLERQGELIHSPDQSEHVWKVRYGKYNRLASIGGSDNTFKIWSAELYSGLPVSVNGPTSSPPERLRQGPSDNLAVYKEAGDIEVLNVITGSAQHFSCSASQFLDFKFGPEHYFAVLLRTGIIQIWDLASGYCINELQIYDDDFDRYYVPSWPPAMAFGTSGRIVTIGSGLKIWNLVTGTSLDIPHLLKDASARYCACSSDGRLACNWSSTKVAIWGSDWTKEKQHLTEVDVISGLSFNANGLLVVKKYQGVEIWNCDDCSMIQSYVIPWDITRVGWDLQYQLGLDTEFGIIDLEAEQEEDGLDLPWCPRSLRLAWTEKTAWLMRGSKRVLWIPRGSVTRRLFSVRTDLETGMSTVAMVHSGHVMILRISAEDL